MDTQQLFRPIAVDDGLSLELIDDHHAGPLFHLVDQNREHLSEWMPWVGYMQTVADFEDYIHGCKQQHKLGTDYGYVILQQGFLIGRIGIHGIQKVNRNGAIGYWLGKAFEGKGIITKACTALVHHCFSNLNLNRVEIKCGIGNRKSAAIAQRLGFTREGILRGAEWLNGGFVDLELYSLLEEEWQVRF